MTGPNHTTPQLEPAADRAPRPQGGSAPFGRVALARVVLVGAWLLVALVHLALSSGQRPLGWLCGYLFLEVLATASLGYRAWATRGEERLAWWLLAASAFLDVINISVWIHSMQGQAFPWEPGLLKVLSLMTGILMLAGILNFPRDRTQEGGDRRRLLDGLLFAASVLFLLWVVGVAGTLRAGNQALGLRVLVAYLQVALLGGGLVFMTSNQLRRFKGPLGWLGASALAWLVVLSGWALAGLPVVPEVQWWWPLVGCIPLFQGLAAWSPMPSEAPGGTEATPRLARLLPYVPVVVALAVMAVLILGAPLHLVRSASGIFLVMVVLLLLRQVQAIQDLEAARRTLEDRVQQRTTALEHAQDTLLRAERMNTVALMGAGLAHDLNNLLCAVKSSADLALLNLEDGVAPGEKELNRIAQAADRAALLTRRLMGFARREGEELSSMDLGREVRGMEVTLRFLLPRSVELHIDAPEREAIVVQSSRLRLEQMLVNLVANAVDAMPGGGKLSIRVARSGPEGGQAMIEVTDSGVGMTEEVLARIFDPFFTTKAPGKGTGLGLPSLKAMVEEGDGRLEVVSELGRGTRFRILIPSLPEAAISPR
ncbi:MAG TPA: ATP-binding protein [Geothrix sp.]